MMPDARTSDPLYGLISRKNDYYQREPNEVLRILNTGINGLSRDEATHRLELFGKNQIILEKKINVIGLLVGQFTELLVVVLIGAGIVSYAVGDPIDTIAIFTIVILNGILGFVQEFKAEKAIEQLKKMGALKTIVKRDGKWIEIPAEELVMGDIVQLEEGSKIPADIRFIEIVETAVDEAILTGESGSVNKKIEPITREVAVADRRNIGYANTVVVRGRGTGVVIATGLYTEFGKIAQKLDEVVEEESPLKKALEVLAKQLTIGVLLIMGGLFFLGYFIQGRELIEMMLLAIALGVAAIPEGLPAVTTITLALGVQKIAARNALIKHLPSAETLGATTVICSDKTGTLTKNEMTCEYVYADNRLIHVTGTGYSSKGALEWNNEKIVPEKEGALYKTIRGGVLCNNSQYNKEEETITGDPTEGALMVLAHKATILESGTRVKEIPFSSERKMMTIIQREESGKIIAYSKGAVEKILEACSVIVENGKSVPLTMNQKQKVFAQAETLSKSAYRVLAVAYREVSLNDENIETRMTFAGLTALRDPPREEAREAISKCHDAGIQVKMITGDHPLTAAAIAEKLGIKGEAITGIELNQLSPDEWSKVVRTHAIFARVDPEHKYQIVSELQKQGHVVAVTGDGVNDAPAIKKADIGIAMGIKGTDVAKEASDMVLRDDNFATIVNTVEMGRTIYKNIQSFVRYLLGANLAEVLVVSLGFLLQLGIVINPIQLLWINLATDAFPALALGEDPAPKDVMGKKPRKKNSQVLDENGAFILVAGVLGAIVTLAAYVYGLGVDAKYAGTMAFTTIVVYELMLVFSSREQGKSWIENSPLSNPWLIVAVLFSFGLQLLAVYVPFLDPIFETEEILLGDWGIILLLGLTSTMAPYLGEGINRLFKERKEKSYLKGAWPASGN